MTDGYEGASVDDIARAAQVSKATIYSYFENKEALFMRVASDECLRQLKLATDDIDRSAPVAQVLGVAAQWLLGFFLSDFGQSIYRICVAESTRFPELGRIYYETGPAHVRKELMDYLQEASARGQLEIAPDELELAANQFIELCRANLFHRRMFFVQLDFSADEIAAVRDGAVSTFLARYSG